MWSRSYLLFQCTWFHPRFLVEVHAAQSLYVLCSVLQIGVKSFAFFFWSLHSLSIFDLLLFDHPFVIFKHLSLKQQSADYQVALLIHIILIFSQSFFALTLQGCMLSEEATDTNVIVWLNSTGARYPLHHGSGSE